jgi:hypothetical protein
VTKFAAGIMKKVFCILFVIQSSLAMAGKPPVASENVFFDVTFWKKKLHITSGQLFQLQDINREMYFALNDANETGNSNLKSIMETWKESTIGVLSGRQKKKWGKLMDKYGMK